MQFLALAPQTKWLKHKPEPTRACSAWESTLLLPPEPLPHAAASLLLELLLLGLNGGHMRLAAAAADWLLDRHHLVGLGFVGRSKPVY